MRIHQQSCEGVKLGDWTDTGAQGGARKTPSPTYEVHVLTNSDRERQ